LLGRRFDPDQPDVAWCGDITCIPTDEGWLYLASVIDLASRHLIGWSMSDRHDAGLVTGALEAAVAAHGQGKLPGTIFHTDRGAEYTSAACANACERLGLRQSMGRTGSCLDNAAAESFFATPEGGARQSAPLPHPPRGAHLDLRLDRLVQPTPAALDHRLPAPVEWEQRHATLNPSLSTMAA
jgi:transposase InsO family protein